MKLAIAYRIYPKVSKETPIFNDDKLKLSEMCLSSFAKTLKDTDFKFWAILDGCPLEYERLFKKYIPKDRLEIIHTDSIGNAGTFAKQMEILINQSFSNNIYFAEDDYFYLNKSFNTLLSAISSGFYDFLTPYDHLDYYELYLHSYKKTTRNISNHNFRNVSSTTLTFLTTKSVFSKTQKVFETYLRKNYDVSLWLILTKLGLYNPLTYLISGIGFVNGLKILAKVFIHTSKEFFIGRKYTLGAPIPSLAVHLVSEKLSPGIDWYGLFESEVSELRL